MSPSEADLRAALRAGEGPGLDADQVLRHVQVSRQEHRQRLVRASSIAAVVVVVGGLGIGAAATLHGSSGSSPNSPGAARTVPATDTGSGSPNGSATSGVGTGTPVAPGPAQDAARLACPASLPRLNTDGATTASLFSGPVEAIKVCAYTKLTGSPIPAAGGGVDNTVYTGQTATDLAASIDAAATTRDTGPCPNYIRANVTSLAIIPVSTSGTAMDPITVDVDQNPCNQVITNGSAVRFDWTPPASMDTFLAQAKTGLGTVQPGQATGTPAR